jgi:hypothetical protein
MQSIIKYLGRELKVPEYSAIFEMEDQAEADYDYQMETEKLFQDKPQLLTKLESI